MSSKIMLLVGLLIFSSCLLIHTPACDADDTVPKALISLDQSNVNVDLNKTELNFATVTGSVFINLNETEHGILQLYAEVEGFTTIIAPNTFGIDENSSSVRFAIDTYIPQGYLGGEVKILNVYGNVILVSDNSSIHPVESVSAMISINPVWSLDIELKDSIIEVPPAQTGKFKLKITNKGHQGLFRIEVKVKRAVLVKVLSLTSERSEEI